MERQEAPRGHRRRRLARAAALALDRAQLLEDGELFGGRLRPIALQVVPEAQLAAHALARAPRQRRADALKVVVTAQLARRRGRTRDSELGLDVQEQRRLVRAEARQLELVTADVAAQGREQGPHELLSPRRLCQDTVALDVHGLAIGLARGA